MSQQRRVHSADDFHVVAVGAVGEPKVTQLGDQIIRLLADEAIPRGDISMDVFVHLEIGCPSIDVNDYGQEIA